MKNIPVLTSLAALVAFAFFPTPAAAGSLFVGVSLVTIFAADYLKVRKPLRSRATLVSFPQTSRSAPPCEQAA